MTPEQIALVERSALIVSLETAATTFYSRLFESAPDLRVLFPNDLAGQELKLAISLRLMVSSLRDQPELRSYCQRLGAEHVGLGARPEHYRLVGGALLAALADQLAPDWTPDLEQAWAAAYTVISELMLSGAAQAGR